jgi:two-component system, OmpR family, sensor kinase
MFRRGSNARTALLPFAAVALGLVGALSITLSLYGSASAALAHVLEARLSGAGATASLFLANAPPTRESLLALMELNELDAAYVVDEERKIVIDSAGRHGRRLDVLRIDVDRLEAALEGTPSVGLGYDLAGLEVLAGYFPLRVGAERTVLVLETGQAFHNARTALARARDAAIALSILMALGLGAIGLGWVRTSARARTAAEEAARGQAMSQMAAMAAHEIRNPLGVIRWSVELMRERIGAQLAARDREALDDVLCEVERLRRLTEDFLDLATARPIGREPLDLGSLLTTCARAAEVQHPGISVRLERDADLDVEGDSGRLEQVFRNLLGNAAEAQREGDISVSARTIDGTVIIAVRDFGPGVPEEARAKLFDPFFTTRTGGTGLGLAISRRHIERHGGSIRHLAPDDGKGAIFEVRLPRGPKGA